MTTKRFIAGAVCPRCSEMDKIRAWRDEDDEKQYRECVSCGYTDAQSLVVQSQPTELPTRVNQPQTESPKADEQVIQFIPNPGSTRH